MTPAEEALRDAFLAECWRPVREATSGEQLRRWAVAAAVEGYASCQSCGVVFRQPSGLENPWRWCPECAKAMP